MAAEAEEAEERAVCLRARREVMAEERDESEERGLMVWAGTDGDVEGLGGEEL